MPALNEINVESFYHGFSEPDGHGAFDDYDEPEEGDVVLDEYCPNCHHEYDEIDYEYQICHICHYENKPVNNIHPLFNEILAIVRPLNLKKRKVKKLVNK